MQIRSSAFAAFLVSAAIGADGAIVQRFRRTGAAFAAAAPAPAPAAPGALELKFELDNVNFFDLGLLVQPPFDCTKGDFIDSFDELGMSKVKIVAEGTNDKGTQKLRIVSSGEGRTLHKAVADGLENEVDALREGHKQAIAKIEKEELAAESHSGKTDAALLWLGDTVPCNQKESTTVGDILDDAIIRAVNHVVPEVLEKVAAQTAGGPAPSPASASGDSKKESTADVLVHVFPGKERRPKSAAERRHVNAPTIVNVTIIPSSGVDLPAMQEVLERSQVKLFLKLSIKEVLGLSPVMLDYHISQVTLTTPTPWNIDECAKHMDDVVKKFTLSYTRRMVPYALYNECTNFVVQVSFSGDHFIDHQDRLACREATVKFAQAWNFGLSGWALKKGGEYYTGPADRHQYDESRDLFSGARFGAPPKLNLVVSAEAPASAALGSGSPAPGPASGNPDQDFKAMCLDICMAKFGESSRRCA